MYIYNVTILIERDAEEAWLRWMQQTHIPEMLATQKFVKANMHKVITSFETSEHPSYAVQYTAKTYEDIQTYYAQHAARLRDAAFAAFGNKFIAIRTELEPVFELKNTIK